MMKTKTKKITGKLKLKLKNKSKRKSHWPTEVKLKYFCWALLGHFEVSLSLRPALWRACCHLHESYIECMTLLVGTGGRELFTLYLKRHCSDCYPSMTCLESCPNCGENWRMVCVKWMCIDRMTVVQRTLKRGISTCSLYSRTCRPPVLRDCVVLCSAQC